VHLFVDSNPAITLTANRLKEYLSKTRVVCHNIDSDRPDDYESAYFQIRLAATQVLQELEDEATPDIWINLSSGFPSWQTLWFLLVHSGQIPGKLIHVRQKRDVDTYGVSPIAEVKIPLANFPRIEAAYGPQYLETAVRLQERLGSLSKEELQKIAADVGMIFQSAAVADLIRNALAVALSPWPVLLLGETGVGKEGIAQLIHRHSLRNSGPFIAVNCGALTGSLLQSELFGHESGAYTGATTSREGLLRKANGGTIFLDEIGNAAPATQASLLRFMEQGEIPVLGKDGVEKVDVRIIAATNRDLDAAMDEQLFMPDLFYRFTHLVHVPPITDRAEDIPFLVRHFVKQASAELNREYSCDDSFVEALQTHSWRGHVRNLRNTVLDSATRKTNGCVLSGDDVVAPIFPSRKEQPLEIPPGFDLDGHLSDLKERYIAKALELGGSQAAAERLLGYGQSALSKRKNRKAGTKGAKRS
jgi:DNA-binding NtrC family response regulator